MYAEIPLTLNTTGLVIAYAGIAALLLGLNLHSNWHWLVKAAANIIVIVFLWITYLAWPGILGWPTEQNLPKQFFLYAINVAEPERIYLWGSDTNKGLGQNTPRAYSLPYSRTLHDNVEKAERKLRKGLPVIGKIVRGPSKIKTLSSLKQIQSMEINIEFIDAPQGLLPQKGQAN